MYIYRTQTHTHTHTHTQNIHKYSSLYIHKPLESACGGGRRAYIYNTYTHTHIHTHTQNIHTYSGLYIHKPLKELAEAVGEHTLIRHLFICLQAYQHALQQKKKY
jgi:hypothetical protein